LNGNGADDFPYFIVLSSNFGKQGNYQDGNFDLVDGIAFPDFLILSANFGNSAGALSAVPEPSGVLVMLIGAAALIPIRNRHRRT